MGNPVLIWTVYNDDGVISKYIIDFFLQSCFDTSAIHFVTHLS